ncbi:MAG TPA: DPP IV N-terminal domain-containing protein [Blastocatellia bacterium]|nr:DPP IV N-terminal domain-containing protein [Blastocatellia bacterium]
MKNRIIPTLHRSLIVALALALGLMPITAGGQDRLKAMPGYEQYQKMSRELPGAVKPGLLAVTWKDNGKSFEYRKDGKLYHYDIATRTVTEVGTATADPAGQEGRGRGRNLPGAPARGRQFAFTLSPDGKLKAFHRDRNLWLSNADGTNEIAVTTDGSEKTRIKYGTASWVYGEELDQTTAMWWSPDGRKIAYYRFDESPVPDYYLQLDQTKLQSKMDIEAYPKAGVANPVADLLVYDLETKKSVRVDVRDGKPFENSVIGHYVYNVSWSPDGRELLFNRTNRRQNVMEFTACNPETGKCRVIVREEWLPSWTENSPAMQFLRDGKRFIWTSERTGWKNLYLYDLSGKLLATLTNHSFEVGSVVRIDEEAGIIYYMARSGDNPMKFQLHRVGLDGKGDRRLTDPAYNHTANVAPDGRHFIDVAQTHDSPPVTRLVDADGKIIEELAKSDLTKFEQLGLKRVELFKFKAADGVTELYGMLHRPSNFDPNKKYPLLVTVYAGPNTNGARENFLVPSALTEYGFLVASLDSRSAGGRGKRFLDAIYLKLGVTEIDDQAAGVKALSERPYVDKNRVGIFGTSYGGYASVMCLLRYPDVFQAASASSPVTDYRHYDTIYTERYMWIPQENKEGYDAGSAMTYADKLKGRLMLYYGTADNNVHPNNTMQLIQALQRAGKSFEVQVGPDQGHSGIRPDRMMEFFIENLVMKPPTASSGQAESSDRN